MALVGALGTAIVSGVLLTTLSGGPTFATMVRVHRASTYALTGLVAGHLVVALGILPGYRSVWRAMHWRGRVPEATVRRLWPATTPDPRSETAADERSPDRLTEVAIEEAPMTAPESRRR